MSDASGSLNPFASPPVMDAQLAEPPRGQGRLKTVAIISVVLGGLGLMTNCSSAVFLAAGKQAQAAMMPMSQPGMDAEMLKVQQEMMDAMYGVQEKFWTGLVVLCAVHFVVAVSLLIGGILCLKRSRAGGKVLTVAASLAITYVIGQTIVQGMMQLQQADVMKDYMQQIANAAGGPNPPPPGFGQMMATATSIGIFIGVAFLVVFALVKIGFYLFTILTLKKPYIRALLQ